ncbi:hypothetical protein EXIGLDRAFT_756312 [Exidia glandulosa HHB12029]|uniref:Uncharacterized protein n=1 Tax=Exidia glandulosa HHB12029 TaxID=1314781 RepID=A0A165BD38_EXIGL|nr:hypothetical protein EXIGLDRAFT_756312 [Exidia glandulosa HHB12029]
MSPTHTADAGLKILTSPPVFDSLYAFCSPGDLCRVAKTCNGASQAVTNYVTHRFTIDLSRLLLRFFASQEDVLEFRRLQAKHQFLISGSAALQLLDRTIYPDSDLDLYLFPNDAEAVGRWLIGRGYEFSPDVRGGQTFEEAVKFAKLDREHDDRYEDSEYALPGVRDVLSFTKLIDRTPRWPGQPSLSHILEDKFTEIQLIVSDVTPYEAILKFHSTVVMNVVTWDRAIALFPLGTLDQRRGIKTLLTNWTFEEAVDKYRRRGFSFLQPYARFDEGFKRAFKFGHRFFGDEHSWVIRLDTTGIDPPEMSVAVEGNSWELDYDNYDNYFVIETESRKFDLVETHHEYCVGEAFAAYIDRLIMSVRTVNEENLDRYIQFFNQDPDQPLARRTTGKAGDSIIIGGNDVQMFNILLRHFRDLDEVDELAEWLKDL